MGRVLNKKRCINIFEQYGFKKKNSSHGYHKCDYETSYEDDNGMVVVAIDIKGRIVYINIFDIKDSGRYNVRDEVIIEIPSNMIIESIDFIEWLDNKVEDSVKRP